MEICLLPYMSVTITPNYVAVNPPSITHHTFERNTAAPAVVICHCSKCRQSTA